MQLRFSSFQNGYPFFLAQGSHFILTGTHGHGVLVRKSFSKVQLPRISTPAMNLPVDIYLLESWTLGRSKIVGAGTLQKVSSVTVQLFLGAACGSCFRPSWHIPLHLDTGCPNGFPATHKKGFFIFLGSLRSYNAISFNTGAPSCTPPKINIEPENDGLEDDFPFQGVILGSMLIFRGVCVVSLPFRGNMGQYHYHPTHHLRWQHRPLDEKRFSIVWLVCEGCTAYVGKPWMFVLPKFRNCYLYWCVKMQLW